MVQRIVSLAERPDLAARASALHNVSWPEFMRNDPVSGTYFSALFTDFAAFQLAMCDGDSVVATGNAIPIAWDGLSTRLPGGWDAALEAGCRQRALGQAPTALCALAIVVHPSLRGQGLSSALVRAMKSLAADHRLNGLVAPVRPSLKSHYPLAPIGRYVTWRLADGAPFDPWLRVHWRLGAEQLHIAPASMVIPGSVAQWESWTGMRFPESGPYVVPGALVPVEINCNRDLGRYVEPNVWMWHRPGSRA